MLPIVLRAAMMMAKGSNYFVGVKHARSQDARKIRTIIVHLTGVVTFEQWWKVGIKIL